MILLCVYATHTRFAHSSNLKLVEDKIEKKKNGQKNVRMLTMVDKHSHTTRYYYSIENKIFSF